VVTLWDLSTGLATADLHGHTSEIRSVAFSPDGSQLASAGDDRTVRLWDVAASRETMCLRGHNAAVFAVAFSPDGNRLVSASMDGIVRLWNLPTGTEGPVLRGHTGLVQAVAFSPDGLSVASAGDDHTVRVWDAATARPRFILSGHSAPVRGVAFSPDGGCLASSSKDGTVRLWNTATGRELRAPLEHTPAARGLAFTNDGQRLAAADGEQVRIWDAITGQELLGLRGLPTQSFSTVAWDADGRRLAAAGNRPTTLAQSVMLWDATPLTPETLTEREARSVVSFWLAQAILKSDVAARIRADAGLRENVRQRALALVKPYAEARIRTQAADVVQPLFFKLLLRPKVLESLRANPTLSDPVRREALALAERFVEMPGALNRAARTVVRKPGAKPGACARALRLAERACELAPHEGTYYTTVGMVRYRLGKYTEAVEALTQADKLTAASGASSPVDLAFLAMSELQLGQRKQGARTLARLREAMQQPQWASDPEASAVTREAEELAKAKADGPPRR
jgi:hypothetical protein